MPEDYQQLLDELGAVQNNPDAQGSTNPPDDAGGTASPATPVTPPANPDNTDLTNSGTLDGTGDEGSNNGDAGNQGDSGAPIDTGDNTAQQRANEAFAAMRAENTKYKKFVQQIMKGTNFDGNEEAFMKALYDASYVNQAKAQGSQVSPELLKRMDSLEEQNKSLIDQQNRSQFAANIRNMQDQLKLNDKDIQEFLTLAANERIDLTIPNTNFVTLYQGLFYNKLKERDIEAARQEWIAQNSKANNASNPDGKSGSQPPAATNVNTMAEFNSLLQSITSDKK